MNYPYDDILAIVRAGSDPRRSFDALREIGRKHSSSPFFKTVNTPDVEADVWLAGAWIDECIRDFRPNFICIGTGTLNGAGANGFNAGIGMSQTAADPPPLTDGWTRMERCGSNHLIDGLRKVHAAYQKFSGGSGNLLFDYLYFLGYSGVVFATAIERINVDWDCLFRWGIGEDRPYDLLRASTAGVTRIASAT
jgi:hypothetical protein